MRQQLQQVAWSGQDGQRSVPRLPLLTLFSSATFTLAVGCALPTLLQGCFGFRTHVM